MAFVPLGEYEVDAFIRLDVQVLRDWLWLWQIYFLKD